ncbi:MAG: hypothetical protein KDD44_11305 [Bdellovibrionales bacterium]|nr:hypothetical protein [Bdellovibrionales bacterium]
MQSNVLKICFESDSSPANDDTCESSGERCATIYSLEKQRIYDELVEEMLRDRVDARVLDRVVGNS